jgi:hypothetical protein
MNKVERYIYIEITDEEMKILFKFYKFEYFLFNEIRRRKKLLFQQLFKNHTIHIRYIKLHLFYINEINFLFFLKKS